MPEPQKGSTRFVPRGMELRRWWARAGGIVARVREEGGGGRVREREDVDLEERTVRV